jgi:hypothetical protein
MAALHGQIKNQQPNQQNNEAVGFIGFAGDINHDWQAKSLALQRRRQGYLKQAWRARFRDSLPFRKTKLNDERQQPTFSEQ